MNVSCKRWGLALVTCPSKLRPPPGRDGVCGPLDACRGARAVAVLVPSTTTPQFKRQIEPVQAPPKRRTTPKGDFNRTWAQWFLK